MASLASQFQQALDNETVGSNTDYRNLAVAYCSGCLFFIGWWLIIDVAVIYPSQMDFPHAYHTVGVFSTIALIMICVPGGGDGYEGGILTSPQSSRLIIFLGFLIGFTCVISAIWIMFQDYVAYTEHVSAWPGVALFFQNLLIFSSAVAWKLGRRTEDYIEF